ncbi:hypothetical protein C3L33_22818, partial [Rhododendron williamsianum]
MGLGGERALTGGHLYSHSPGVRKAAAANAKKTSLGSWIRYFYKDFQPARTVAPGVARDFVAGPQYRQRLYMAGFFSYFLCYYVLPDYPIDGLSQAVFPLAVLLACGQPVALAPLFLGSLYRQLDLVQADYARSLGRCDHLLMAHTNFLLAYFFEHFRSIAPVPLAFQASRQRSRAEQWYGTSSNASWYEACDIEANFTPRPYNIPSPGVMGVGLCLLPSASSLSAASGGDSVARTVVNATLIALPGWLPFLNNETTGVVVYRLDRFARQLRFDQGVPGPAPPIPSFAVVPEASTIRTRDTSLRAITEVRAVDWLGPHSQWAVIDAAPLNKAFPAMPPLPPQAAPRCTGTRVTRGRTQPPPPAEPSQPSSSHAPAAGEARRPKRLRTQWERDASTFVAFEPEAAAAAEASEQAVGGQAEADASAEAGADVSDIQPKRLRLDSPAAEDTVVVTIFDSPEEQGEIGIIQPRTGPITFPHQEPESSLVIEGMLPDKPSVVDLGGDPNTVSIESSSSSEESENIIVYFTDRNPSPSNATSSEARQPPPSMDAGESVGQADIAAEPINAVAAQLLREEEEDNVEELPHAITGGPAAGQARAGSTSTPSGSQQQSTSARIRSTESFLGRVAGDSPGVPNASFLQGPGSAAGRDAAADATSPHSPACSTSQTHSPHPSARRAATLPAESATLPSNQQLEVNEELCGGPTSITDSDLNYLFQDMTFLPTDDVLGGQGSQALGDFGLDLNLGMGDQQRDEVESREQPSPRRSPVADGSSALRPEIQELVAQLESARQHVVNLESRFAQVMQRDAELAAAVLNLEDPDPEGLVFADWLA